VSTQHQREVDVIAGHLARTAGLVFDDSRRAGLHTTIEMRAAELGCSGMAAYATLVMGPHGDDERQALIDAVTIQETFFFRNGPQMQALRRQILPELIRAAARERRTLTIWSAGCSTGEEPYSIAMLTLDVMEDLGLPVPVRIVGTDVSSVAIERAREGRYRGRSLDLAEDQLTERWFVDEGDGLRGVHPDARALVEFELHNLVGDPPPFDPGTVDLVLCRNVTIYFAKPTTAAVIASFHRTLRPRGVLVLGHAETLWQVSNDFDLVPLGEAFVYRASQRSSGARPPRPRARTVGDAARRALLRRSPLRRDDVPVVVPTSRDRTPAAGSPLTSATSATSAAPTTAASAAGPVPPQVPRQVSTQANERAVRSIERAEQALADARYRDAYEAARDAAIADSLAVAAYAVAGRAAVALGDDDAAIGPLRKAVFLEPGCAEAHFMLAGVLSRDGQHRAAAAAYRAAGQAVATTADERLARMLDGRDPESLVELCERLAESADAADSAMDRDSDDAFVAGGA
jgi:chemotaxis protein methyltransferase CheR